MNIKIIENFITWQGEGVDTGKRLLILRFKTCSRACKWCDTQVKMRITNESSISLKEIQKIIDKENCGIMITGGEPTFSTNLKQTTDIINQTNCYLFNVETNGHKLVKLIEQVEPNKNVHYILSPKIFNNEDFKEYVELVDNIKDNPNVYIKLVYEPRDILTKFLDYLKTINFDNHRVYLMPEGTTKDVLLEHASIVFDIAEKYKFNFSSREHIIYQFI